MIVVTEMKSAEDISVVLDLFPLIICGIYCKCFNYGIYNEHEYLEYYYAKRL